MNPLTTQEPTIGDFVVWWEEAEEEARRLDARGADKPFVAHARWRARFLESQAVQMVRNATDHTPDRLCLLKVGDRTFLVLPDGQDLELDHRASCQVVEIPKGAIVVV